MKESLSVRLGALLILFFSMPSFSVAPGSGAHHASLLQRGSRQGKRVATSQGRVAAEGSAAATSPVAQAFANAPVTTIEQVMELSLRERPQNKGHFLTNSELAPINSIACLQAKQANPAVQCDPYSDQVPTIDKDVPWSGELNAGNFPSWKDPVCQSNGEFFCDPYDVLDNVTRSTLTAELRQLRESSPVACGAMTNVKVDANHYQPFYLGVVILKDWPVSQSGPDYLQQLGQLVAAQWNMDELYVGSTIPYLRCPNTGMLFVFPGNDQVYLSTESCRFVCQAKGGPQVQTAALAALRGKGGAAGAASTGARALYSFLQHSDAAPPIDSMGNLVAGMGESPQASSAMAAVDAAEKSDTSYTNLILRVIFIVSLIVLCVSLVVAMLVFVLAPELYKKSRKR